MTGDIVSPIPFFPRFPSLFSDCLQSWCFMGCWPFPLPDVLWTEMGWNNFVDETALNWVWKGREDLAGLR